ncbi:unnamed protein product [Caenorhabditis auriculariae]|uniref:Trehalase n=1 Tax=Caenorhabditis auriculariae TaxID=2777116 RepID=A0A8S1HH06_9PELO|nr:unnamed protein product [Caenorhabditis auriculariae]
MLARCFNVFLFVLLLALIVPKSHAEAKKDVPTSTRPPDEPLSSEEITAFMKQDFFTDAIATCDNETAPNRHAIYCSGRLLQAVMAVRLYKDSKTFLDQPIRNNYTANQIIAEFDRRFPDFDSITRADVKKFVDEHFEKEGHELEICHLPDWVPKPKSLDSIVDPEYQEFATRLHYIWIELCREMSTEVRDQPERFSLLYVPRSFVVPGGRFREFYYWDAYWIVKGLLASELHETAKNMVINFAYMIHKYGFVPNGGRVYYLRRSQPPMFAATVYEYFQATGDVDLLEKVVPLIEKEFEFWVQHRSINVPLGDGSSVDMFQYRTEANTPRPESFREDVLTAKNMSLPEKRKFFRNIASAAESGWDFSSRWFKDGKSLEKIVTTDIVPVDLNAYICYNMRILAHLHSVLGNPEKHEEWSGRFVAFREQFTKLFYVSEKRGWYDYNHQTQQYNFEFYPTIAIPLFAQCYDAFDQRLVVDVYRQMEATGAFQFASGVPTSLQQNSTEQWDYPNSWSPLNHMIIEGLRKSISPLMQQKAYRLAEEWVRVNFETFNQTNAMWEKYNVVSNKVGHGGEYEVQLGFGWTNGVALDLMKTYGDRLVYYKNQSSSPSSPSSTEEPPQRDFFVRLQELRSSSSVITFSCSLTLFVYNLYV